MTRKTIRIHQHRRYLEHCSGQACRKGADDAGGLRATTLHELCAGLPMTPAKRFHQAEEPRGVVVLPVLGKILGTATTGKARVRGAGAATSTGAGEE